MNCQHVRALFPQLLDDRDATSVSTEARAHLARCPDCQEEFAALHETAAVLDAVPTLPPSSIRENFFAALAEEQRGLARSEGRERAMRTVRPALWRQFRLAFTGLALLAGGFFLGGHFTRERELVVLRQKLDQQDTRFDAMSRLIGYSILRQQETPPSQRVNDVILAAREEKATDQTLDLLISAVTLDPNVNVRLRALEALQPHITRDYVRAGVLSALSREQHPLVQIALINLVTTGQVQQAAPMLEKIAADSVSDSLVRGAAKLALAQL